MKTDDASAIFLCNRATPPQWAATVGLHCVGLPALRQRTAHGPPRVAGVREKCQLLTR